MAIPGIVLMNHRRNSHSEVMVIIESYLHEFCAEMLLEYSGHPDFAMHVASLLTFLKAHLDIACVEIIWPYTDCIQVDGIRVALALTINH